MKNKLAICLLILWTSVSTANAQAAYSGGCGAITGVNMSGGEYSWEGFPLASDLDYIKSKGLSFIRLPISWEKFQPDLNGPLDANQVSGIKAFLDTAELHGVQVIVDIHNYARYNSVWTQMTAWNLWSNGYIESPLTFPSTGSYNFIVQAKGSVAGGIWPNMIFRIDGTAIGSGAVSSASFANYTYTTTVSAGIHNVAIEFTNDAVVGSEDRNLYVAKMNVTGTAFSAVLGAEYMPVKTMGGPTDYRGEGNTVDGTSIQIIGSTAVPVSSYQDFWTRFATELKGKTALWGYDIMNEPYDMPNGSAWPSAAQAAVNTIRTIDTSVTVFVEGTQWSSAENWMTYNSTLNIIDPNNKLVYEAHQYFDNGSGTYTQTYDQVGATPMSGVTRVQPFLNWIQSKGAKGYLGEFGIPDNDPRWLVLMDNLLSVLRTGGIPATYWNYDFYNLGDPSWWHTHGVEGINPADNGGVDEPQMALLTKYATDICAGVKSEVPDYLSITVFPNPASGILNIEGIREESRIKLYDVFGKLIAEKTSTNNLNLDLKQIVPGIYLLEVSIKGERITKKIVKE